MPLEQCCYEDTEFNREVLSLVKPCTTVLERIAIPLSRHENEGSMRSDPGGDAGSAPEGKSESRVGIFGDLRLRFW